MGGVTVRTTGTVLLAFVLLLSAVPTLAVAEPNDTATAFVGAIRRADLEAAKRLLEGTK